MGVWRVIKIVLYKLLLASCQFLMMNTDCHFQLPRRRR